MNNQNKQPIIIAVIENDTWMWEEYRRAFDCSLFKTSTMEYVEFDIKFYKSMEEFLGCNENEVVHFEQFYEEYYNKCLKKGVFHCNILDKIFLPKRFFKEELPKWLCINIGNKKTNNSILTNNFFEQKLPEPLLRDIKSAFNTFPCLPVLKKNDDINQYICIFTEDENRKQLNESSSSFEYFDKFWPEHEYKYDKHKIAHILCNRLRHLWEVCKFYFSSKLATELSFVLEDNFDIHNKLIRINKLRDGISGNILPFTVNIYKHYPNTRKEVYIDLGSNRTTHMLREHFDTVYDAHFFIKDVNDKYLKNLEIYIDKALENNIFDFDITYEQSNLDILLAISYSSNEIKLLNDYAITGTLIGNRYRISKKPYFIVIKSAIEFWKENNNILEFSIISKNNEQDIYAANIFGTYGYRFFPQKDIEQFKDDMPNVNITYKEFKINNIEFTLYVYYNENSGLKLEGRRYSLFEACLRNWLSEELIHSVNKDLVRFSYSQIMARNQSHNLGSHAVNKMIGQLRNGANPTPNDMSNALEYIKLKMDYISAFAFAEESINSFRTVSVYEMQQELDKYKYMFNCLPDTNIEIKFEFRNSGIPIGNKNDILISLPDSGKFAFYNVLEAIVRNAAKHEKTNETMTIVIEFGANKFDHHLYFEKGEIRHKKDTFSIPSDEVGVLIYRKDSNCYNIDLENINSRIKEPVVDPKNMRLNYNHLGLKEIRAAILYMRGVSPDIWDETGVEGSKTELVSAVKVEDVLKKEQWYQSARANKSDSCPINEWGYYFELKRSMEVLIVSEGGNADSSKWKEIGTQFYTIDDLEEKLKNSPNANVSNLFLVFNGVSDEKREEFLRAIAPNRLPMRIVSVDNLDSSSHKAMMLNIWKSYFDAAIGERMSLNGEGLYKINNVTRDECFANDHDLSDDQREQYSHGYYYLDELSSLCQKDSPLFNFSEAEGIDEKIYPYIIADYTTMQIYIFDERIQRLAINRANEEEKLKNIGIHIPDISQPLDSADASFEDLERFVNNRPALDGLVMSKENTVFIVHESLLQRLLGSNNVMEYLNKLKKDIFKDKCTILITTGRGKPTYIEKEERKIRFIPFSLLMQCMEERNKYKLYNAILSSRG